MIAAALATGGPSLLFTANIRSHALRSTAGTIAMFCNFAAYTLLPLADATAIGFAAPLFVVVMAAVFSPERVHAYRWSAVVTGFLGVILIAGPDASSVAPRALWLRFCAFRRSPAGRRHDSDPPHERL